MGQPQKSGKGGRRKIGRSQRKLSQKRYNAEGRCDRNKRKRILRSCGEEFLKEWDAARRRPREKPPEGG